MSKEALFNNKFNSITNVVEFNPLWYDDEGYFDAAVNLMEDGEPEIAVTLKPGEMAKCISSDHRKMIFVGTDFGTCVVFQKYSSSFDILIVNQAKLLANSCFIENDALTYDALKRIVGGMYFGEPNIGVRIANVRQCFEIAKTTKSHYWLNNCCNGG
jgi:hypothetical protein